MHHGNQPEKIEFVGNGIRVLDLKREILERKKISGSLDFDLKVMDESNNKGALKYLILQHFRFRRK
jgi:DWNN domain